MSRERSLVEWPLRPADRAVTLDVDRRTWDYHRDSVYAGALDKVQYGQPVQYERVGWVIDIESYFGHSKEIKITFMFAVKADA